MTDKTEPEPVTRRSLQRFEVFVLGWLAVISAAVTLAIVAVVDDTSARNHQNAQAASQSQALCERSIRFAPALGVYFLKVKALTPAQDKAYVSLLPNSC